jgi:hypothetical protein
MIPLTELQAFRKKLWSKNYRDDFCSGGFFKKWRSLASVWYVMGDSLRAR